jgi:hypothetical protein
MPVDGIWLVGCLISGAPEEFVTCPSIFPSSAPSRIVMGRKRTGVKPGRKTDLTEEQVKFLETYSDRFRAGSDNGSLYMEVTVHFLEKFGYAGVPQNSKEVITASELGVEEPDSLDDETRTTVSEN